MIQDRKAWPKLGAGLQFHNEMFCKYFLTPKLWQ